MTNQPQLDPADVLLIDHARDLVMRECALDLEWIDTLRKIYSRKLYLAYGSKNFHVFCTEVIGMSSDSAWRRMHAASLADRFPSLVKPLIAEGKVHLTGLALLDRVITPDNGERLIQEAVGKSTLQIKAIIAREAPEVCTSGVRKQQASSPATWRFPEATKQLSETTWRFQATMDAATKALLEEVQDLQDNEDYDQTLREALKAYRDVLKVRKQKALKRQLALNGAQRRETAAAAKPVATPTPEEESKHKTSPNTSAASVRRSAKRTDRADRANTAAGAAPPAAPTRPPHDPYSSYIPNWMEREVRERAGHQCTFVGYGGRCAARRDLQVHHIVAEALGGTTEVWNLTLHCGVHNRFQAVLDLGPAHANAWKKREGRPAKRAPAVR